MVTGFKNTEVGLIPEVWEAKPLGSIGEVKMCKRVFNSQTSDTGIIPFYKIGTFGKEPDAFISEELFNSYRIKFAYPKQGDILISASGTIGRTVIFDGKPAYFQDSNIIWIENDEKLITNKLLFHIYKVVNYNTEGGTIQRLYNDVIKNTFFPLPPTKAEQTAIATALNDADALITALEKLIAKKKAIKQGAMQELLTGRKRLPGFEVKKGYKQTEIGMIPEDWEVKSIGEVCEIFGRIGFRGYTVDDIVKPGYGAITLSPSNIQDGNLNVSKCTYISWLKYEESPEIKIFNGDILLVKTGSTFGKTTIVKNLTEKATVNPQIVVLKKILVDNYFLSYLMGYDIVQNQINSTIVGGAIPTLSQKQVASFQITIPSSKAEQTAIATILSDMDAEIDALEQRLEKQRQLKQGMMQVLLTGKIRLV